MRISNIKYLAYWTVLPPWGFFFLSGRLTRGRHFAYTYEQNDARFGLVVDR